MMGMLPRRKRGENFVGGEITPHEENPSRLEVRWDRFLVVMEREIWSGRISNTKAMSHTAYDEKNGQQ